MPPPPAYRPGNTRADRCVRRAHRRARGSDLRPRLLVLLRSHRGGRHSNRGAQRRQVDRRRRIDAAAQRRRGDSQSQRVVGIPQPRHRIGPRAQRRGACGPDRREPCGARSAAVAQQHSGAEPDADATRSSGFNVTRHEPARQSDDAPDHRLPAAPGRSLTASRPATLRAFSSPVPPETSAARSSRSCVRPAAGSARSVAIHNPPTCRTTSKSCAAISAPPTRSTSR